MIQQLCIDTNHIQKLVSEMSFAKNGDNNEHKYGSTFKNQFPNCELFWQQIIVPVTNRIDPTKTQGWEQIKRRVGVSDDVLNMIYLHYTIFLHLVYAFDHLSNPRISSFVNFYTHLGSICDLAEDFLLQIYLIVNECKNCTSPLLQEMKKEAFIEIAGKWYDKKYPEFYENYHKKGKSSPIHIPSRDYILREYFPESSDWTSYINFSKSLREYRNQIVHNVAIGNVIRDEHFWIPKKECIFKYKKLQDVLDAANDEEKLKKDFIIREVQMYNDFMEIQKRLDALWKRPINDLTELLYKQRSSKLLEKYHLQLP